MSATTDDLPNLETEARRLTKNLQSLQTVNDGLGAAATRVEHAARSLDAAHDALRETSRRVESLNGSAAAALAAIDRLQPDQLRSTIEAGFADSRANLATLHQQLAADLDALARELGAHGAAQSEANQRLANSAADAAGRVLAAVEETRRQIDASEAAMRQAVGDIRAEQAALAAALATLQRDQQALAGRTRAIETKGEQIAATADLARKSVATIEQDVKERLPALAADIAALHAQTASAARTALIRQIAILVVSILLIALLNGMLVRFVGMR
jgi:predicted  nucleic acid-binding Zn-ribbon protein